MTRSEARAPQRIEVIGDPGRAATILDPSRRGLIAALMKRPDSASGLSRRLGESRQRINYHLRELERAGFVELVEERRKGNCLERVVRASAQQYLLDPLLVDPGAPGRPEPAGDAERARQRFSATYLIVLAARMVRELALLRERAHRSRKKLATYSLVSEVRLARPADFEAFCADLSRAVARVVAEHHDERTRGSRRFRLILGAYPVTGAGEPIAGSQRYHQEEEKESR